MHVIYPMRERDRIELRKHREEVEAFERAEQAERDRPIREAEANLKDTAQKLAAIQRENILKLTDDEIFISPELANASMPQAEADTYNAEQVNLFIRDTPEYAPYRTPENAAAILDYLKRNGVMIFDAETLRVAFFRLRDYGLLTERPAPEPEAEPRRVPHRVNLDISPQREIEVYEGWNLETGEKCLYAKRQVDAMSSEEFRRCFRIYKDSLSLPNLGPGSGRTR